VTEAMYICVDRNDTKVKNVILHATIFLGILYLFSDNEEIYSFFSTLIIIIQRK